MTTSFRPPAVPLVTADPYFSVWSFADSLTDGTTRHWTGKPNGMAGLIRIDGDCFRFLGTAEETGEPGLPAMCQTELEVRPLSTCCTFRQNGVELRLTFTAPLLLSDPDVLSRPVNYLSLSVRTLDGKSHSVALYTDITAEWCVNTPDQEVSPSRMRIGGTEVMCIGTTEQRILGRDGDDVRIDWGFVCLALPDAAPGGTAVGGTEVRRSFIRSGRLPERDDMRFPRAVQDDLPLLACAADLGTVDAEPVSRLLLLAYDDVLSVEYFGRRLPAYWRADGQSFEEMLRRAAEEYPALRETCDRFDAQLYSDALRAGGEEYAEIASLAYRQAVAAHKVVRDEDDRLLFFSKENFSNGCMATVDVSYPSSPLFLLYNPEFVKGMLRPVFRYARSPEWTYDFAPHDVGRYPLANGQVYGDNRIEYQMPVEECGNMLIMTAAVCRCEGSAGFAAEYRDLLEVWAQYLMNNGMDPGNQLCTDDFAGHLAHNANLSVKAILGIASYGMILEMSGNKSRAAELFDTARGMAAQWEQRALDGDHYRLAFDREGTWSQKYNMVWDRVFGLHLFPPEIAERETAYYLKMQNRYGLPLDSRKSYTKADWIIWSACLAERGEDFTELVRPLRRFLNESQSRVPFTDWYDTLTAKQEHFQNRSVVGGVFMKLLIQKLSAKA